MHRYVGAQRRNRLRKAGVRHRHRQQTFGAYGHTAAAALSVHEGMVQPECSSDRVSSFFFPKEERVRNEN